MFYDFQITDQILKKNCNLLKLNLLDKKQILK